MAQIPQTPMEQRITDLLPRAQNENRLKTFNSFKICSNALKEIVAFMYIFSETGGATLPTTTPPPWLTVSEM